MPSLGLGLGSFFTINASVAEEAPFLRLSFVDIADVSNPSSVTDWNSFFTQDGGISNFTSVEITGNDLTLLGGSNVVIGQYRFSSVLNYFTKIESLKSVIQLEVGSFSGNNTSNCELIFNGNIIVGGLAFENSSRITKYSLIKCTSIANDAFDGIEGQEIILNITPSLVSGTAVQTLVSNNTVTVNGVLYWNIKGAVGAFEKRVLADSGTFEAKTYLNSQNGNDINTADLVYIPSSFKASKSYAIKPTNGSGDLIHTRSSSAFRQNGSNVFVNMANNVGRVDYVNNVPTLLLEPSSTNQIARSNEIIGQASNWFLSALTATSLPTAGLDGGAATKIVATATNANHFYSSQVLSSISLLSGETVTISIYVKNEGGNFCQIVLGTMDFTVNKVFANFDLVNKTVVSGNYTAASITEVVGTSYFKCSITAIAAANGICQLLVQPILSGATGRFGSFTGNDVSGVTVWNNQSEKLGFSTSPIKTTTSALTRVADVFENTNASNFAAQGTVFIWFVNNIAYTQSGTFGNGFYLGNGTQYLYFANVVNGRIRISDQSGNLIFQTSANNCKLAITYNGSVLNIWQNGIKVVTNYSFVAVFDRFGCNEPNAPMHINRFYNYKTVLSDSSCAELTTI